MKYIVKYEDVVIGSYIDDEDNAEYIVYQEGIDKLHKMGYDLLPMIAKSQKGNIAFFDNRINNCKRFPGKKIGYHTDSVELEEVN